MVVSISQCSLFHRAKCRLAACLRSEALRCLFGFQGGRSYTRRNEEALCEVYRSVGEELPVPVLFCLMKGANIASEQQAPTNFPQPGWVEHDPWEIWDNSGLYRQGNEESRAKALICGHRHHQPTGDHHRVESKTGKVWHNAIVWQDLRGAPLIDSLKEKWMPLVAREKRAHIQPVFRGLKIAWLLDNVTGLREEAERARLSSGPLTLVDLEPQQAGPVTDVTIPRVIC